jgi:MoaA/NifB/PqqE/SkfB family radical SAM enzyme/SAM-dependent methyltransferase
LNNAVIGKENDKLRILQMFQDYCGQFDIKVFECGVQSLKRWGEHTNANVVNTRKGFSSVSHGSVIYEYLEKHSEGTIFTLLTHSDVEFVDDISNLLAEWQGWLISDRGLAGVQWLQCGPDWMMPSTFALWKTPILHEYAINQGITTSGIEVDGKFYDTLGLVFKEVQKNYAVKGVTQAPIKHVYNITSMCLYGDVDENKNLQVKNRLRGYQEDVNMNPTVLQLELTKNCNNRCIMCHKGQHPDFVKTDISDVVLRQVKPVFPYLRCAILFGDGEPMLYPKFWQVIQDIREASPNCAIEFVNNGSLMTSKSIDNVLRYEISRIGLSMGGAEASTHNRIRKASNFDRVVANYRELKKAKELKGTKEPYVYGLIIAMKSNYQEIPKFVALCSWLGFIGVGVQQLFVTHPSMENEIVSSEEVEVSIAASKKIAEKCGISFWHYPLDSQVNYWQNYINPSFVNMQDRYFRPRWDVVQSGYCRLGEPWHTAYVLYDGTVIPDCHWWSSKTKPELNICGKLDENNNILDIWNGDRYKEIRRSILAIEYLPQCRGCGLAGGVKNEYRCSVTDHINPDDQWQMSQVDTLRKIDQEPETSQADTLRKTGVDSWYVNWLSENTNQTKEEIADHHVRRIMQFNPSFGYKIYLDNIELSFQEEKQKEVFLKSSPLVVDIELSNLCNYRCITCQSSMFPRRDQIPEDVANEIVEMFSSKAEVIDYAKVGEPFMLKERLMSMIKRARENNPCIHQRLFTRAALLDEQSTKTMVDYGFESITVSIDGSDSQKYEEFTQTNNFDLVLKNLKNLRDYKLRTNSDFPHLMLATQLTKYSDPVEIMKIAVDVGATYVGFCGVVVFPDNEKHYNVRSISAPQCYGGYDNLHVLMEKCREIADRHKIGFGYPAIPDKPYVGCCFPGNAPVLVSQRNLPDESCPTREPWYRLCIAGTGIISPCCHHGGILALECAKGGHLPVVKLPDIWNHPRMQGMRALLRQGQHSPQCHCDRKMSFDNLPFDPDSSVVPGILAEALQRFGRLRFNQFFSADRLIVGYHPPELEIDPTTVCNLRCVMCHNSCGLLYPEWYVDLDTIRQIRDFSLKPSICRLAVSLTGSGEFFLHPQWKEILSILSEGNCDIEILTNGTLLSKEDIDFIWSKSVKKLQFSVDAASSETYRKIRGANFEVVLENIRYACNSQNRKMVPMSFVVIKENLDEMREFVQMAYSLGADGVVFQSLHARPIEPVSRGSFTFDDSQHVDSQLQIQKLEEARKLASQMGIFMVACQFNDYDCDDGWATCRLKYFDNAQSVLSRYADFTPACWIPWRGMNLDMNGFWRACCMSAVEDAKSFGGPNASPEQAWNSTEMQEIRRLLLSNQCPRTCLPEFCKIARSLRIENNIAQNIETWRDSTYFEEAETHIDEQWDQVIWPFIQKCSFDRCVELAPGHGRCTRKMLSIARELHLVDATKECIEYCQHRFGDNQNGTKLFYYVNDGKSVPLPSNEFSFFYCWDSMVHFDINVVAEYIKEITRVLQSGGCAFLHHADNLMRYTGDWRGDPSNPHSRTPMSKEDVKRIAMSHGIEVVMQSRIPWSGIFDCLTLLRKSK